MEISKHLQIVSFSRVSEVSTSTEWVCFISQGHGPSYVCHGAYFQGT